MHADEETVEGAIRMSASGNRIVEVGVQSLTDGLHLCRELAEADGLEIDWTDMADGRDVWAYECGSDNMAWRITLVEE